MTRTVDSTGSWPDGSEALASTDPRAPWFARLDVRVSAALLYLVVRLIGLLALAVMAKWRNHPLESRLANWDAGFYLGIINDGYARTGLLPDGSLTGGALSFFPVYPYLVRPLTAIPGLSDVAAGSLTSLLAGLALAVGLAELVRRLYGDTRARRIAPVLVVLVAAQPMGVVFLMVYAEATFTALAVWSCVALRADRFLTAGVLMFLAGLARPTGIAAGAGIALWLLVLLAKHVRANGWRAWRGEQYRQVAAMILAVAGTPLFILYADHRLGLGWGGWFRMKEAGWGGGVDWGQANLASLNLALLGENAGYMACGLLLLGAVVLGIIAIADRVWLPLLLSCGLVPLALMLVDTTFLSSKPRYLLPLVALLIPPAIALAKAKPTVVITVLVAATLGSAWFGAYMLCVFPYAI